MDMATKWDETKKRTMEKYAPLYLVIGAAMAVVAYAAFFGPESAKKQPMDAFRTCAADVLGLTSFDHVEGLWESYVGVTQNGVTKVFNLRGQRRTTHVEFAQTARSLPMANDPLDVLTEPDASVLKGLIDCRVQHLGPFPVPE